MNSLLAFASLSHKHNYNTLKINYEDHACSTHQIRDKMAQILQQAPDFKIKDIITTNKTQINKLIACLFVLFSDINIISSTTCEQSALESLHKLTRFSLSDYNLFDHYRAGDGIKYNILSYLSETDIHHIMSNVSSKWNSLCRSTFNHPKFQYTFKDYFNTIKNKIVAQGSNGKSILNENPIIVYIQCPWNHLWTYGNIKAAYPNHLVVRVFSLMDNPFSNIIESRKNDRDEMTTGIIIKTTDDDDDNINYSGKTNGTGDTVAVGIAGSDNNYAENEVWLGSRFNYFNDGYHHIAPLNTIDSNFKFRNINADIHIGINNNCINCGLKNDNYNDYDNISKKMDVLSLTVADNVAGNNNNNNVNVNSNDYGETDERLVDYFERQLVDIKSPFIKDGPFWLWPKNGDCFDAQRLPSCYPDQTWNCGIIDMAALNREFPRWKIQNNCNANRNDIGRNFQLPVLVEISPLCFDTSIIVNKDDNFVGVEVAGDEFLEKFCNVFKYGKNCYFTRIWVDPRDITKLQPFGSRSSVEHQRRLLGIPALSNRKCDYSNVVVGLQTLDSKRNIFSESRLGIKQLMDEYVMKLKHGNENNISLNFEELSKKSKTVCFRDNDGEFIRAALVLVNHDSAGYEIEVVFELPLYSNQRVCLPKSIGNCNGSNYQTVFYIPEATYFRSIINFDVDSLFKQLKWNWFGHSSSSVCARIVRRLLDCDKLPKHFQLLQPFGVKIKPYHISLKDNRWQRKWSSKRMKKMKKMKRNVVLWEEDIWANFENVISDLTFKKREWKIGILFWDNIKRSGSGGGSGGDDNVSFGQKVQDVADAISLSTGQCVVYIDITKEYNEFQQRLKKDWVLNHPNKSEKGFYDALFFSCKQNESLYFNRKQKRMFCKYCVHLDDVLQVTPLYSTTSEVCT